MFRTPIIPAAVTPRVEEEQLARAIAASLATQRTDRAEEKEALDLALALSRSLADRPEPPCAGRSELLRAERLSAGLHRARRAREAREHTSHVVQVNLTMAESRKTAEAEADRQFRAALERSKLYD